MLSEKIDMLMKTLNVSSADIARLTGRSPTSVSRLRKGSRRPKKDSPTIRNFAEGICFFAKKNDQTEKLRGIIHSDAADNEKLHENLIDWLYSDDTNVNSDAIQAEQFKERLEALTSLADISYAELSKISGIDYSYLMRMKKGQRFPKKRSDSISRICRILYDKIRADGKERILSELTHIPKEMLSPAFLRDWMCGFSDISDTIAVQKFLGDFDKAGTIPDLPPIPDIMYSSEYYYGNQGLQSAVIRFLSNVREGQTLLLYSDAPTDWMNGDFILKWSSLLIRCLKLGARIRIIHNIERNMSEIFSALQNWIPLYMTGLIEPYYCEKPPGERFHYTLFINKGNYAVCGISTGNIECEYSYVTECERLKYPEAVFDSLISQSRPLLTVSNERQTLDNGLSCCYGNAEIFADKETAVINRNADLCVSFRIIHPKMSEAIYYFLKWLLRREE